jgi:hypothetical protein
MPDLMLKQLMAGAAVLVLLTIAGCGHDHDHPTAEEMRTGPSGGVMLTTRNDAVNVEYIHQPAENRVVLTLLDQQLEPIPNVDVPPMISIVANGDARQFEMTAVPERPATFEATDPSFAGEDFVARATVEVRGEAHQVDLIEPQGHHHHH